MGNGHDSVGTGPDLNPVAGITKWTLGEGVPDSGHGRSLSLNFGVTSSAELVTAAEDL